MDDDGYPDDDDLAKIAAWPHTDFAGLMAFVKELWRYGEPYWSETPEKWEISTAGWSGNESLIGALQENRMFWYLCWEQSRRGGHYIFDKTRA